MIEWIELSILALYYLILGILAVYGLHRLHLVVTYQRTRGLGPQLPEGPRSRPVVTVQLPIFNEKYVAERLIDAVCAIDYPSELLEIQVLDDSTDETKDIVAAVVERLRRQGIDIHHLHREDRTGFKAGALEAGLQVARGELLAVFDADFLPTPDYLNQAVPYFADPDVGMVQCRWGHINRDYSLLTRIQAVLLDGHFVVEHTARHRSGCFFNFNGTAGIWRRQAIVDAGGWEHDTLTEDLDLSYRSQLAGWNFCYLPDVVVPAELPAEINAYKSQQHRWAKGSIQTGRKLLRRTLGSNLPWHAKLEAFVHLTANVTYLLMAFLSVLVFPAMYLRRGDEAWKLLAFDLPLFLAATVSVVIFFVVGQRRDGIPIWRTLLQMPALMAVGIGLAVNNTRAVWAGLWQDGGVFHRTPKYNIESVRDGWTDKVYTLRKNLSFYIEAAFALYFIFCFVAAVYLKMWLSVPFLWLFLQGYVYMTWLGLAPARKVEPAPAVGTV